jgi:proteasome lid subunit RPN8/RPN11
MAVADLQADFDSWSAEGHALRIEYAVSVLEEICADAVDGLYRFRHGGIEVGGVLFGEADGDRVRVLAYRPLPCEHAFGPRFVLSDRDRASFKDLLYAGRGDAPLGDMEPVGWYHSHTRSGIELSPRDLEIYDSYFPQRWQIALVVRPDHYGPARAGFFFRESNNQVRTVSSYQEFTIRPRRTGRSRAEAPDPDPAASEETDTAGDTVPPAEVADSAVPEPEVAEAPATPAWVLDPDMPAPVQEPPGIPGFALAPPRSAARKWLWLLVAGCLLAAMGLGAKLYDRLSGPTPPLQLWVADLGGQLRIEWDRTARPIRDARSAALEIVDGKERRRIPIDAGHLRDGGVDYVRNAEIVDVRLKVRTDGGTAEEFVRFVGPPIRRHPSAEAEALRQAEALKAEVASLRAQLEQKDTRIRRLTGAKAKKPATGR